MADVADVLDRKAGPLTGKVWLGIVGGGVALGVGIRLYRRSRPAPAPQIVDEPTDELGVQYVDSASPFPVAGGFPTSPGGYGEGAAPGAGAGAPQSNTEWAQLAISELIARGYNPVAAQQAITRYITGEGLDVGARALVDEALRRIGSPPELVPPQSIETIPTPGAPPVSQPTTPSPAPTTLPAINDALRAVTGTLTSSDRSYLRYRYRCSTTGNPNECQSMTNMRAPYTRSSAGIQRLNVLNSIPIDAIPSLFGGVAP